MTPKEDPQYPGSPRIHGEHMEGCSKREHHACEFMAALISQPGNITAAQAAIKSVEWADALIEVIENGP